MSSAATRVLQVINVLKGNTLQGLAVVEIAKALNCSQSNICRSLDDLIEQGFAVKLDTGRYALSVRMLQIATAHAVEMQKASERIAEINQRVHTIG